MKKQKTPRLSPWSLLFVFFRAPSKELIDRITSGRPSNEDKKTTTFRSFKDKNPY
jgi:hypothetical protein